MALSFFSALFGFLPLTFLYYTSIVNIIECTRGGVARLGSIMEGHRGECSTPYYLMFWETAYFLIHSLTVCAASRSRLPYGATFQELWLRCPFWRESQTLRHHLWWNQIRAVPRRRNHSPMNDARSVTWERRRGVWRLLSRFLTCGNFFVWVV